MSDEQRDFNAAAASWDQEPARVKMAGDVAAAIADAVPLNAEMDVLDFGCGTGLLALQLQPFVRSVTGIDSSPGMLAVFKTKIEARHLARVTTRCLDVEKGGTLEGAFHLVTSSMTLHHVKHVRPLLDQCRRILVPGGFLCLADLDPDDGQFHGSNDGVFHPGFERVALRRMLAEAGFDGICDRTASSVMKPARDGGMRQFTIFLMTARAGA